MLQVQDFVDAALYQDEKAQHDIHVLREELET